MRIEKNLISIAVFSSLLIGCDQVSFSNRGSSNSNPAPRSISPTAPPAGCTAGGQSLLNQIQVHYDTGGRRWNFDGQAIVMYNSTQDLTDILSHCPQGSSYIQQVGVSKDRPNNASCQAKTVSWGCYSPSTCS